MSAYSKPSFILIMGCTSFRLSSSPVLASCSCCGASDDDDSRNQAKGELVLLAVLDTVKKDDSGEIRSK